ncbi:unnamed protein product [Bursaphelenchus okinawaensis]|uniref:Uncharacterized protein n=1 Tax=Bursaphelenchus okinawaensis TaxID=465554 RepID=A0A811KMP2_9BILA|nr:unnamed protein product [Bursaphelenchus okinawaensis]CAG9105727.1 unnamed protein product [Bursaphelenchus okinawaensis]
MADAFYCRDLNMTNSGDLHSSFTVSFNIYLCLPICAIRVGKVPLDKDAQIRMSNSPLNSPSSYNSLTRSASSLIGTLPRNVPAKSFGTANYMLKEEYERDRIRWQQKLDEAEAKLAEASVQNTELSQVKAQLNKKIIDIEKNQKPLIEYNKRLAERNKTVTEQCKELEDNIAFVRDENLTLKDAYDRLAKDNSALKEQRAFPERLEELERYRTQVLELSKCITALRASIQERDRRHELLILKFKKIKKSLAARRENEDDRFSCIGSEASTGSTIALDTIAEDLDEDPSLLSADTPQVVLDQLDLVQNQISELRGVLLPDVPEVTHEIMLTKAARMKEEHKNLQEKVYMLELELANARDTNELLEFQLVELSSVKNPPVCQDKSIETDEYNDEGLEVTELEPRLNFDDDFVSRTKTSLRRLERLFALNLPQKEIIHHGVSCISGLEHKLSFAQNQLNMNGCELSRLKKLYEEQMADLQRQVDSSAETSSQKKKELKNTIEELRDERIVVQKECEELRKLNEEQMSKLDELNKKIEESNKFIDELKQDLAEESQSKTEIIQQLQETRQAAEKLRSQVDMLHDKENKLFVMERNVKNLEDTNVDLEKRFDKELMLRNSLELKNQQLIRELEAARKEIERLQGEIRPIGSQLERRYEESRYRLAEALKMIEKLESQVSSSNQVIAEMKKADGNGEKMAREIVQLKRYNDELSAQFNTQMDLISELKKRFLIVSQKTQGKSESNESISWTSKSSSMDDEQYHSEEGGSEKSHQLHHGSI